MKHLSYRTIQLVMQSWEIARRKRCFEEEVGVLALQKLFELEPRSKDVFGFKRDYMPSAADLVHSGNLIHAIRMIHMFDAAISMLGPDTETLNEILEELGKRHIRYGVKPHYYPFMGHAVIYALSTVLGKQFWTPEVEEAWVIVYDHLSGEIMKSILNHS